MTTRDRPIYESVRETLAQSRRVVESSEAILANSARLVGSAEQSNTAMREDLSVWRGRT